MVAGNQRAVSNPISIFHHNVCGIKGKTDELIGSVSPNPPHILCFSEHHLKTPEIDQISIDGYRLGAVYSRQVLKGGGVCIFIQNNLECTNVELDKYCKEQDIEACMIKLTSTLHNILIMTVYRAPSGNFNLFLKKLDDVLKSLYRADLKVIICGDININYLTEGDRKSQLDAMLLTYGLASIVHFPTRSQGLSSTAIDNIFIDTNQFMNYIVSPLYNGLADHDAQLLTLNDIHLQLNSHCTYTTRSFNTYSVEEFITKLSYESWGNIFSHTNNLDVDTLFNAFLSDYLRLFYTSFPICKKST